MTEDRVELKVAYNDWQEQFLLYVLVFAESTGWWSDEKYTSFN
jgi:hypothetical protein